MPSVLHSDDGVERRGEVISAESEISSLQSYAGIRRVFREKGCRVLLKNRQSIVQQGDHPRRVYFVEKGSLILEHQNAQGETVARWLNGPLFVGLREYLLHVPHHETITANGPMEAWALSVEDVAQLVSEPSIAIELIRLIFSFQDWKLEGQRPTDRVLSLLLRLSENGAADNLSPWVSIPSMSQEKIADLAGVSRRTVCRALAKLKQEGLIRVGRKDIRVHVGQAERTPMQGPLKMKA